MRKVNLCKIILYLTILSSFLGANEVVAQVKSTRPSFVSLVQLIANPNEYHGRLVLVIGFCHLEFEGNAIYLHREDFEQGIYKNGLWLDVEDILSINTSKLSDGYILVEGVFNAKNKGHLGQFSGCLGEIERIEHSPSRKELE